MTRLLGIFCLLLFQHVSAEIPLAELDAIFMNKEIPTGKKEQYIDAFLLSVKSLENKGVIDIIFELPPLCAYQNKQKICVGTYTPFNPSIIKFDQGYYVTCRVGDYKYPNTASVIKGVPVRISNSS